MDFAGALSPVLAQAGHLFPNTPMAVEQLFHLRSDSTAHPFDISFSPGLTACHYCPYTTIGTDINITGHPHLHPRPTNLKTFSTQSLPMQTTIFNAMNAANLDVCTSPPPPPHLSSTVMTSSASSTKKTWSLSLSPLTPGYGLVPCYRYSSPPPTIPTKNPRPPHTPPINITDPMPTSCMNAPPNHHAHLGSSHQPTFFGNNLPRQHAGRSLATPTLHPHQVYTHFNSSDSAFLRHTAHSYVTLPLCSNFIPLPLHLNSTLPHFGRYTPRK